MEVIINKKTNAVSFDLDFITYDIDLSGLSESIEMIIFDTETRQGLKFFSEAAKVDDYLKPEEVISEGTFLVLAGSVYNEALARQHALENPVFYYKTTLTPEEIEDGFIYVGFKEAFIEYPQPTSPPEGYTSIESPNPEYKDDLVKWTGSGWVRVPFELDDDLNIMKEKSLSHLRAQIATHINHQLRTYSLYDIIEFGKTLKPTDSKLNGHLTMESYINELENSVSSILIAIESAIYPDQLKQLSYEVSNLSV